MFITFIWQVFEIVQYTVHLQRCAKVVTADSVYSNTVVTLIEQSHVYSCMLYGINKQGDVVL